MRALASRCRSLLAGDSWHGRPARDHGRDAHATQTVACKQWFEVPPASCRHFVGAGWKPALLLSIVALTTTHAAHAAEPIEIVLEPVRSLVISAPVDGVIEHIAFDEGDAVKTGATLVKFVRAAEELHVERAREVLRKRTFDYAGVERLFNDKMTSETEKLEKEIERRVAEIDLAQAIEQRDLRIVKAVHGGTITERHHESGEYVERGTPLLELIDQDKLDARCYVRPEDGLGLAVGDHVWIRIPLVEATVRCRVVFVDPLIDPSSGLMRVRARLDNSAGRFKSGLRGWLSLGEKEPPKWP